MSNEKHTVETIEPCLEIDEHLPLQEKGWIAQRVGWALILGVMIAGGLGLFGEGLFSKQSQPLNNGEVEYERFFRYETEMKVLVQSANHISSISFPEQYLRHFRIVRFVPEPAHNNTINQTVQYNFSPSENHIVSIYMIPKEFGAVGGTMKINEKDAIHLHHFIYP